MCSWWQDRASGASNMAMLLMIVHSKGNLRGSLLHATGAINSAIFHLDVEYEMYTVMSARVLDT